MAGKRKRHDEALLARCVARVLAGDRPAGVAEEAGIPYSTLMTRVAWKKRGQEPVTPATRKKKRPKQAAGKDEAASVTADTESGENGDPPTQLPPQAERDLLLWMVRLQRARICVRRRDVLNKANAILTLLGGVSELGAVWFTRFRERHPEVTGHGTNLVVKDEAVTEMDASRDKTGAAVSPWTSILVPTPESNLTQHASTVTSEDAAADAGSSASNSEGVVGAPAAALRDADELDMTPSERAVALLQESYSEKLAPEDLAEAFDVALDPPRAKLLLILRPGELRDLWITQQIEKRRQSVRSAAGPRASTIV
jgi:hypothetical protein